MREPRIGRLVIAALHQAIAEPCRCGSSSTRTGSSRSACCGKASTSGRRRSRPRSASCAARTAASTKSITSRAGVPRRRMALRTRCAGRAALVAGAAGVVARALGDARARGASAAPPTRTPASAAASRTRRRASRSAARLSARSARRSIARCAASTPAGRGDCSRRYGSRRRSPSSDAWRRAARSACWSVHLGAGRHVRRRRHDPGRARRCSRSCLIVRRGVAVSRAGPPRHRPRTPPPHRVDAAGHDADAGRAVRGRRPRSAGGVARRSGRDAARPTPCARCGCRPLTRAERVRAFEDANLPTAGRAVAGQPGARRPAGPGERPGRRARCGSAATNWSSMPAHPPRHRPPGRADDRARAAAGAVRAARARRPAADGRPADRRRPPAGGRVERPTAARGAFENYVKGLIAETAGDADRASSRRPCSWRPTVRPRRTWRSGEVYADQGDLRGRWPRRRRCRRRRRSAGGPVSRAGRRWSSSKPPRRRVPASAALADERPTAALYNNLGVIQIRRPPTPQTGKPTYYFTKASELDPEEPDYFFNLGYAYWLEQDTPGGDLLAARSGPAQHRPTATRTSSSAAASQATGAATEGGPRAELARQLSSRYAEWEKSRPAATSVPKALERASAGPRDDARPGRSTPRWSPRAQREQRELATFHLDRGRRFYEQRARSRGADRAAEGGLPVALRGRAAPADRPRAAADRPGQARRSRRCRSPSGARRRPPARLGARPRRSSQAEDSGGRQEPRRPRPWRSIRRSQDARSLARSDR